jgi:hypothetical protein
MDDRSAPVAHGGGAVSLSEAGLGTKALYPTPKPEEKGENLARQLPRLDANKKKQRKPKPAPPADEGNAAWRALADDE